MVQTRRQSKKPSEENHLRESEVPNIEHEGNSSTTGEKVEKASGAVPEVELDSSGLFVIDREGPNGGQTEPNEGRLPAESRGPGHTGISSQRRHGKRKSKMKNTLTSFIPGYTAPMGLNASSLDKYRSADGIGGLRRAAARKDASTRDFVGGASKQHTDVMQGGRKGLSQQTYTNNYSSFKRGKKRAPDDTAGDGWFGMVPSALTEELRADLNVIRNRSYLDPKKFYKSADKSSKFVQVGTVIEGAAEFFSSRLTKKQRRANLTEEIMADPASADYARKKFAKMSRENNAKAMKRSRIHRPKRGKRGF